MPGDAAVMLNQTLRVKIQIIVLQCVMRTYKLSLKFNRGWQVSNPPYMYLQYLCGAQLDLRQVFIFMSVKFSYDIFHDLFFFLHIYNSDLSKYKIHFIDYPVPIISKCIVLFYRLKANKTLFIKLKHIILFTEMLVSVE